MRAVHVLFYRPNKDDRWLNHVVTTFSPPFSHCDLQFDDNLATSIYQNEPVYMETKSFSRLNYERHSICVSDDEYRKIRKFCENKHKEKIFFDPVGMVMSFFPLLYWRAPSNKTFCSRYITEALQASERNEFKALNSIHTTPSSLYNFLSVQNKSFLHISDSRLHKVI